LVETPSCWGRKVARLSASNRKVPPGLRAYVLRILSSPSHATTHGARHSPSTKRTTVPLGPAGPAAPAGPSAPAGPGSPLGPGGASKQPARADAARAQISADKTRIGRQPLVVGYRHFCTPPSATTAIQQHPNGGFCRSAFPPPSRACRCYATAASRAGLRPRHCAGTGSRLAAALSYRGLGSDDRPCKRGGET
jgi:hypothetical protein